MPRPFHPNINKYPSPPPLFFLFFLHVTKKLKKPFIFTPFFWYNTQKNRYGNPEGKVEGRMTIALPLRNGGGGCVDLLMSNELNVVVCLDNGLTGHTRRLHFWRGGGDLCVSSREKVLRPMDGVAGGIWRYVFLQRRVKGRYICNCDTSHLHIHLTALSNKRMRLDVS